MKSKEEIKELRLELLELQERLRKSRDLDKITELKKRKASFAIINVWLILQSIGATAFLLIADSDLADKKPAFVFLVLGGVGVLIYSTKIASIKSKIDDEQEYDDSTQQRILSINKELIENEDR